MNTFVKTTDPDSMTIFPTHVHGFEIIGVRGFDFIRLIFRDTKPGAGALVVHTDHGVYATQWNAMGKSRVSEFVRDVGADYLADELTPPRVGGKAPSKQEKDRMHRMVEAIQDGLRSITPKKA